MDFAQEGAQAPHGRQGWALHDKEPSKEDVDLGPG